MSKEYKLSHTASEIDEKLSMVDPLREDVDKIEADLSNTFKVGQGGTGVSNFPEGNFILGNGDRPLINMTPEQVTDYLNTIDKSELDLLKDEFNALELEVDSLELDINSLETKSNSLESDINTLKLDVDSIESDIEILESKIESIPDDMSDYYTKVEIDNMVFITNEDIDTICGV